MAPPETQKAPAWTADAPERDEALPIGPGDITRANAQQQPRRRHLPADKEARAQIKHAFSEMILADDALTFLQKLLGGTLVRRSFDKDGYAYEDAEVLGALLGVTRQAIGTAGKALEARGYFDVLRVKGRGNVNQYFPQWDIVTDPQPLATRLATLRGDLNKTSSQDDILDPPRRGKCNPRPAKNVIHGETKVSSSDGTTSTTSTKNSESAREAFEGLFAKMPERSRKGSSAKMMHAAWTRLEQPVSIDALSGAVDRWASDPASRQLAHYWISDETFREWLAREAKPPTPIDWPSRLEEWTRSRFWISTMWGPDPSCELCRAPAELLTPEVRRPRIGAR